LLRELCEAELALKPETTNRNRRILQIKDESDGVIEKLKNRSANLFRLLEKYAVGEAHSYGLKLKTLRFGTVRVLDGECNIDLNLFIAFNAKGKL